MKLSERLGKIPPYLFAEIDKKVDAAKAKGIDIINLGIGDPDTPTFPHIVEEMHKAIDDPSTHNYPPYQGTSLFREACSEWMKSRFNVSLNPENEVLALIGSKEAIAHVFFAFVDPGDYTLVPDPAYPVYRNATLLAGGTPYFMQINPKNNYLPELDKIPEDIAKKSKLIFLNYPNNPTGAVANLEYFKEVVDFANKYGTNIKELRLQARSVFVLNAERSIIYVEYVDEMSQHLNFDELLTFVKKLPKE